MMASSTTDEFGAEILSAHNRYRSKHGSNKLKWSAEAASKAQTWANHLAKTGSLQHGGSDGMGQNLAYKSGGQLSGQDVADMWYSEIKHYNFSRPGFSSNTGHFTQMVWAATTHVGAGRVVKGNQTFVVANYTPAGNITNTGFFEQNVKKAQ